MKKILLTLLIVAMMSGAALAMPYNTRPDTSLAGHLSALQGKFDALYGVGNLDVYNDALDAAYWTTTNSTNSTFTMKFEYAAYKNQNTFGLYNYGTPSNQFEIFAGPMSQGDYAVANFNAGSVDGVLVVNKFDSGGTYLGNNTYTGVNSHAFGFYLNSPDLEGKTFYSDDALNEMGQGGSSHFLAYAGLGIDTGQYWLNWEDLYRDGSADLDFTDMTIFAESINPVPEPGTLLLLGAGFIGLAYLKRRKEA